MHEFCSLLNWHRFSTHIEGHAFVIVKVLPYRTAPRTTNNEAENWRTIWHSNCHLVSTFVNHSQRKRTLLKIAGGKLWM